MLLWLIRGFFIVFMLVMSFVSFSQIYDKDSNEFNSALRAAIIIGVIGSVVLFVDLYERNKQITTISAVSFGLLMGLLLGSLFWVVLEPLMAAWLLPVMVQLSRVVITVVCCYISISLLLQTKDEFRFIIPYVEFSKQLKGGKPLVLDTSVIIDGRIADICDTRIIDTKLIVPRFVLQELQAIADSSDKMKRNRGRRGLDILKRMQTNNKIEMEMHEGNVTELRDADPKMRVDERLVIFTKAVGGRVVTNDFNLNKIAQLQGVDVINLNEVSNALKTVALPGEYLMVRVVKQGDQLGQGVGYLEDGTMVVVEQGKNAIGQEVPITVTSVLQTQAGRMIFGKIEKMTGSAVHTPLGSNPSGDKPS